MRVISSAIPLTTYRAQRRGGKGKMGMETKETDFVERLFTATTHSYILFFTNKGRVYWLKVHQIPEASRQAKGKAIVNLIQIGQNERVTAALPIRHFTPDKFILMATKRGIIKKTELDSYSHPRPSGIIAITLEEGDELIAAEVTDGKCDVFLGTRDGLSIRFSETDVREIGRTGKGVIGIRLDEGNEVVGMEIVRDDSTILTVTENGYGKRSTLEDYRSQGRGGKGIITIKITEKNGRVIGMAQVSAEDEIILITSNGKVLRIRAKDISVQGRNTQGVRLFDIEEGDKVVSFAKVAEREEEKETAPEKSAPEPSDSPGYQRVMKKLVIVLLLAMFVLAGCDVFDKAAQNEFEAATKRWNAGDYQNAVRLYFALVKEHPSSSRADDALYWAGVTQFLYLGETEKALQTLRLLLKRYPHRDMAPAAQWYIAQIYELGYSDYERATEEYRKAAEYSNREVREKSLYSLADNLFRLGKRDEARDVWMRQVAEFPNGPQSRIAYYRLGTAAFAKGDLKRPRPFTGKRSRTARTRSLRSRRSSPSPDVLKQTIIWPKRSSSTRRSNPCIRIQRPFRSRSGRSRPGSSRKVIDNVQGECYLKCLICGLSGRTRIRSRPRCPDGASRLT